jgi:uncharacterized membrane protein
MTTVRADRVRTATLVIALAGVALAAYLTWVHYDVSALVCSVGDCHTVQSSDFATVGPVPVALLGLGMYATVAVAMLVARMRPELATAATVIAFATALGGAVYSVYLTWLEVAVIGAICQWCVASAILTLLLAVLTGTATWRLLGIAPVSDRETSGVDGASWQTVVPERGTTGAGRRRAVDAKITT